MRAFDKCQSILHIYKVVPLKNIEYNYLLPGCVADPDWFRGVGVNKPCGNEQRAPTADPMHPTARRGLPIASSRVSAASRQ